MAQVMSERTRQRQLAELRKTCIEQGDDPVLRRVAYAMEMAVRRVTEPVVGWPSLATKARALTDLLRGDLARTPEEVIRDHAPGGEVTNEIAKKKPEPRCSQCGRTFRARPCWFSHAERGGWWPRRRRAGR